jgi:AraC family transcriptional regulator
VIDDRCTLGAADKPYVERHDTVSLSYVRKGSFGCRARGKAFELVAGSILVGYPGDEYLCTHDHGAWRRMPVLQWAPALVETIGGRTAVWRSGCLPPLPELMVLGELAQAVADSQSDIGLDQIGLLLADRFVRTVCRRTRSPAATPARVVDEQPRGVASGAGFGPPGEAAP